MTRIDSCEQRLRNARLERLDAELTCLRAMATTRAAEAVRRVQELDPNWQPAPSLTQRDSVTQRESIEGSISRFEARAREAEARYVGLLRAGPEAPGPRGESAPLSEVLRPGGRRVGERAGTKKSERSRRSRSSASGRT